MKVSVTPSLFSMTLLRGLAVARHAAGIRSAGPIRPDWSVGPHGSRGRRTGVCSVGSEL
jgi:hypothetical protein